MKKEKAAILKSPSNIRIANQIVVMDCIRERPISCIELSKKLSLSNPALKLITEELLEEKLIVPYVNLNKGKKGRGRQRVLYTVDNDIGVFAAIDLSGRDMVFCISDASNQILIRDTVKHVIYIDEDVLKEISRKLKNMLLSDVVNNRPLLGICISSPGKFDKLTHDFISAPRVKDCRTLNIQKYFENEFHVQCEMFNDINLGLAGEARFGSIPKDAKNVFFVFIDITSGSSLMFNGDLYTGSNGFAGEMANINEVDDCSRNYLGRFFTITDIYAEIHDISKDGNDPFFKQDVFQLNDVVERYKQNDPIVSKAVDKSARVNALQLLYIANLLDLDYICIDGRILDFGKEYFETLLRYFRLYDKNFNTVQIITSSLNHDSNLLGAVYQASGKYLLSKFAEMAKKRTNFENYGAISYFANRVQ